MEHKVFACTSCTRRKVKCDKAQPICSTCARLRADCIYQDPQPHKKRKREPEAILNHYKELLRANGIPDPDDTQTSPAGTSNNGNDDLSRGSTAPKEPPQKQAGQLYSNAGNHRYIESTLWRSFRNPEDILAATDEPAQSPFASAILGVPHTHQELLHPSPQVAATLWEVYKDRVDPIIKILHTPTTAALIAKETFTKQEECLVFAIYLFAAMALNDEECIIMLGQDRGIVLQLHNSLNTALLNADFLRTTNLNVMQALILLLVATRGRTDAQLFWIMTGVAIRIAQRMGLHRDGTMTGLSPFDTEISRRLFWQLPGLEGFAGQFAGVGSSVLDTMQWDTRQPLNLNDADLTVDMPVKEERKGATDMLFLLVRSTFSNFYKELVGLSRQIEADPTNTLLVTKANERIDAAEDLLELKFLRYCDPMEPLHLCASLMARVAVQASRFRVRLPVAKSGHLNDEEMSNMHNLAMQVFDRFIVSQMNPALKKFWIHTSSFVLWDILVFVLNHLHNASSAEKSATWQRLESLYQCQEHLLSLKLPIALAITKHVVRAWDATETGPEPAFITKIRANVFGKAESIDPNLAFDESWDWAFWDQLIRDPDSLAVGSM